MNSNRPSKGKIAFCLILDLLGKIGLITSSIYILITILYHQSFDQWMPLRVLLMFCFSVLFLLLAAHLSKDNQYSKVLFGQLPFIVTAFACLGLIKFLSNTYFHRVPHHLNKDELYLFVVTFAALVFCFWHFHLEKKKQFNETSLFVPSNLKAEAQRVLKPSSRPYIALGVIFGFLELIAAIFFVTGTFIDGIEASSCVLGLYGVICLFIAGQKVIIAADYVAYKVLGRSARAIYFKDITKSHEHCVAERGMPFVLDIYTSDSKRPALRIPVKPFKPAEIKWLLSLPEMKTH